jgi:hypothetical protein
MYFMLGMVKESTQNALSRFFQQAGKRCLSMSRQAFSRARQKIRREAPEEMFHTSVPGLYHEEWERRNDFRLLAADGSFIHLPRTKNCWNTAADLGMKRKRRRRRYRFCMMRRMTS